MKNSTFRLWVFVIFCLQNMILSKAATITSPVITTTYTKTTDTNPLVILEKTAKFTFDFSSSSLTGSENLVIYFWSPAAYYPSGSSVALTNEGNKIWSLTFTPTTFFNLSAAEIATNTNQFWFNIQNPSTGDLTGSLHTTCATPVSTAAPSAVLGNPSGTYALDAPVTWKFDLSNSGFKAGQDVYMYAWSPSIPDPNYSNSTSISKLTYIGNKIWSITLTPTAYFGKSVSEIQAAGFWMKLKDQAGKIETATFSVPFTIGGNTQNFYFDFGPKDGTNGDETTNADINGNYWNNISNLVGPFSSLKNSTNSSTNYSLSFSGKAFLSNGKLHGGLLSPYSSQLAYNSDLAVGSATEDYIYTQETSNGPMITLSGLDTNKKYKFKIFGSRNTNGNRTSQYTIQGDGDAVVGTLATSVLSPALGGTVYIDANNTTYATGAYPGANYSLTSQGNFTKSVSYYGNNSSVYVSEMITPSATGTITLTTVATLGGYAYINAMKVEEYDLAEISATSIAISGGNISNSGASSQMSVVYTPTNASPRPINWSVDDNTIATINTSGLLSPIKNGTVTVTASINQNGQTISATKQISITNQIVTLYVAGTATSVGENQVNALTMNPTVGSNGAIINGQFELATTLNTSGSLKFYASQTDNSAQIYGAGATTGTLLQDGPSITPGASGPVLIRVYLATSTYRIYPIDTLKISQMGSSVSFGWGATSNQGYSYQYNQQLNQRYNAGKGANWHISNISIGGNTTVDLLNRWDSDLLNDGAKYVVYALSLANEGIMSGGQAKYDQFKSNLELLINKAKSCGKIPVIANCYTNGYYSAVDYNFVKQMNLLIHQWDVASINLLGGIDDGSGKWPVSPINYQYDSAHPNDAGHEELFHTLVPSLYDALMTQKQQPTKKGNTYIELGKQSSSDLLDFTPDNVVHSFTTTFDIKTVGTGCISTFTNGSAKGSIIIESSGVVTYQSPLTGSINSQTVVNDGAWHKITLTHYYAWGQTILYVDNNAVGSISEKLTPATFTLSDSYSPDNISYREWMLYRAGMNANEIAALNSGSMLKSSLEMYAPLDGLKINSNDELINLAQSTNKIVRNNKPSTGVTSLSKLNIRLFPNPVENVLQISGLSNDVNYECSIYSVDGRIIDKVNLGDQHELFVGNYSKGGYLLNLKNSSNQENIKLSFLKK